MVSFLRNQQPVGELQRVAFAPPSPPKQNNNDCLQLLGATLASPRRRSTGSCHRGAGGERTGRAAAAAAAAGLVGALQRLGRLRLAPLHAEEGRAACQLTAYSCSEGFATGAAAVGCEHMSAYSCRRDSP